MRQRETLNKHTTANEILPHGFRIELDIFGHCGSIEKKVDPTPANEGCIKEEDTLGTKDDPINFPKVDPPVDKLPGVQIYSFLRSTDEIASSIDPPPLPPPLPPRMICACPFENSCSLPAVGNSEFCGACT